MFRPIARKLVAAEVFEQLKQRIVEGEVGAGSSLPAERTLATMLGVNRNAVREGLKRLEQAGLVAIQQGGATRVLDYRRHGSLGLISSLLVRADGSVDVAVVKSVVELRSLLGPIVARLACERADRQERALLGEIVARMREAKQRNEDVAVLARLALDLWAVMVAATKNLALELAYNSLAATYGSVLEQMKHVMADEVSATEDYARLSDAVAARRCNEAVAATERITARGQAAVMRLLRAVEDASAAPARSSRTRRLDPEPPHERKHRHNRRRD